VSASVRVSFDVAVAWIDAIARRLDIEDAPLSEASGRVLGEGIRAPRALPPGDCAAVDGLAVRAEDSLGASAYNPLPVPAFAVMASEVLPAGTDAVVPLGFAERDEAGRVVLVEPVFRGANIDRQGAVAAAGALLIAAGTRLRPQHIGLAATAGMARMRLVRRPRVRLAIVAAARWGGSVDSNGPMVRAAVERDGGLIVESSLVESLVAAADMVLVIGGAGRGREDGAAAALAASGTVEIHGVALVPGEAAGFGHTAAGVPVMLLPGMPAACLCSYELFAGRAIRRLGGHDPSLPYRSRIMTTARKIVSSIGTTEICPIRRLHDGRIEPVAAFAEIGLMAAVEAAGFVIVPEASEGYPQDARVTAYLYDEK
jgi:molybdopterin molybdotransferase